PVKIICEMLPADIENTWLRLPTALAFTASPLPPYILLPVFAAAWRCRMRCSRLTMLMCTVTGMPSSTAAAQNGSSAVETLSPPDGQFEITTPLAPRALALRSPSTAESMPSDGICAMPMSRVGSGAQNSSNRKLLYASPPAVSHASPPSASLTSLGAFSWYFSGSQLSQMSGGSRMWQSASTIRYSVMPGFLPCGTGLGTIAVTVV